jgi:hypothetical protein
MRQRNQQGRLNFWPAYVDLMIIIAIVGLLSGSSGNAKITKIVNQREAADRVIDDIKEELRELNIRAEEKADGISLPESMLRFASGSVNPELDDQQVGRFEGICHAIKQSIDKKSCPDGKPCGVDERCSDGSACGRDILTIVIEGHTDSIPINGDLSKYYPTNWELSAARATTVLRRMRDAFGSSASQYHMMATGYGDSMRIDKTFRASERNRRIEIKILPNYGNDSEN